MNEEVVTKEAEDGMEGEGESQIQEGSVSNINLDRGFGFVTLEDEAELFFHGNELRNCADIRLLRPGDRLTFTIGPDSKNPEKKEAKDIRVNVDLSSRTKQSRSDRARSPYHSRNPRRDYPSGARDRSYMREERYYRDDPYYDYERGGYDYDRRRPPMYDHRRAREQDARSYYYDYHYRRRERSYERDFPPRRRSERSYIRSRSYMEDDRYDRHEYDRYMDDDRYDRHPPRYRDATPPRENGAIKNLTDRGYGFVEIDGKDFFFPANQVVHVSFDDLEVGQEVSCMVVPDPKDMHKMQAQNVRLREERGKIEHVKTKFGHIVNDFGERIFFHRRHLQEIEIEDLKPGLRVVYQTVPSHSKKGTFEAQYIFIEDSTDKEGPNDLDQAEEFKEESPEP